MTIASSSSPQPPTRIDPAPATLTDQRIWRGAIGLTLLTLAGFGFLYTLAGVGIGQVFFPATANGSLMERDDRVVGSALVAQPFASAHYFQARPSAANYNTLSLAGSNQARTNPEMRQRLDDARTMVAQREGIAPSSVPNDLITQSGSGIDPHITPEGAAVQINRVAVARGMAPGVVTALVAQHTENRQLGVLGQPRVHVLTLNLALDAHAAPQAGATTSARAH